MLPHGWTEVLRSYGAQNVRSSGPKGRMSADTGKRSRAHADSERRCNRSVNHRRARLVKSDERHEETDVRLSQLVAGNKALLAKNIFRLVEVLEEITVRTAQQRSAISNVYVQGPLRVLQVHTRCEPPSRCSGSENLPLSCGVPTICLPGCCKAGNAHNGSH